MYVVLWYWLMCCTCRFFLTLLWVFVLLQGMRQRGTQPDVFSYNGVMQANVGGGNWAAALEVWAKFWLATVADHAKTGDRFQCNRRK